MSKEVLPSSANSRVGEVVYDGPLAVPNSFYSVWCALVGDPTEHHVNLNAAKLVGLCDVDAPGGLVWEMALAKISQHVKSRLVRRGTKAQKFHKPVYPVSRPWVKAEVTEATRHFLTVRVIVHQEGAPAHRFMHGYISCVEK